MRPSTPELIAAIVESLERHVAPHVQDKWAASTLRSTTQLLRHAAIRAEREGAVLMDDNRDVRQLLESLLPGLAANAELAVLCAEVRRLLQDPDPDARDLRGLDRRNEGFQSAIEQLLRNPAVRAQDDVLPLLRGYLRRRLEREHPLYFPVFTGPPF